MVPVVVPGRGRSWFFRVDGNAPAYGVLGPFSGVDYVRLLHLSGGLDLANYFIFSAAYGASREMTAVSLGAGTPVVQRSQAGRLGGQVAVEFNSPAGGHVTATIACGFRGGTGSQWLVLGVRSADPESELRLLVSAEVMRLERRPGVVEGD